MGRVGFDPVFAAVGADALPLGHRGALHVRRDITKLYSIALIMILTFIESHIVTRRPELR